MKKVKTESTQRELSYYHYLFHLHRYALSKYGIPCSWDFLTEGIPDEEMFKNIIYSTFHENEVDDVLCATMGDINGLLQAMKGILSVNEAIKRKERIRSEITQHTKKQQFNK
ncbi:hypothetical protein LJC72_03600 [Bacteroides sp. OttesenSCG-928-D19]|nr:hypothetical protein [Bacteroides sp. OttesenSCG-928-D19]